MKKLLLILLSILLFTSCYDPTDPHIERVPKHGMQAGTDSMLLGGTIFYVDSVQGYCLIALVSLETEFKQDCQYPTWCPYYKQGENEVYRFIEGLSDTILGGRSNSDILVREYGCGENPDCNMGNGFYGAWCSESFVLAVYDTETGETHTYNDYWAANLRETMLYATNVGSSMWFSTTTQCDKNNYYTYNCRDGRTITEPKSQKRMPLTIRMHKF